jgi:Beta-lactamase class C and other penicillin binding proteins
MTSGLDDASGDPDCTIDTCLEYLANAGSRWAYHNAPYTLLDSVISQATGMSLNSYFTQKVKNPIGMNGFYFYQGYYNVFFSTARSMARFGLLLLNEGNWNGNQILTDQDYFTEMTSASQSLNPAYGYLTWLNNTNQFMAPGSQIVFNGSISPDAPAEMYAAMGKNGQFINIVQSEDLVWVRMGDAPVNDLVPFILNNEIWQHLNQLECQNGGVFENEFLSEFKLTPNPASNFIEVNTASPMANLQLEDIHGNLIELKVVQDTYSKLDLSDLKVGTYFLRLTLLNGVVLAKRFVKY